MPSRRGQASEAYRPPGVNPVRGHVAENVGWTRRQWTSALGFAGTAIPLVAQTPQTAPAPVDASSRLAKATKEVRDASERLAQLDVAMNVEPAFLFRP